MNERKYERIIIKIEDKNKCKLMPDKLSKYKTALYTADIIEIELNSDGVFTEKATKAKSDLDVIVCTSFIQSGQSIKENVLILQNLSKFAIQLVTLSISISHTFNFN